MSPRPATINDYRWLYAHGYMTDGLKCAREVMLDILERCPDLSWEPAFVSFLDYGSGRGDLVSFLNKKTQGSFYGWDPAMDPAPVDSRDRPGAYDWLISCDVLEHIAETDLDATLTKMCILSGCGLILTIANMSDVHLVNGEPVQLHLIQKPADWWLDRLRGHMPIGSRFIHREINKDRFAIIVEFP